jgi:hypothetical protein
MERMVPGKRIMLMASIALDGSSLKPVMIVPRETADSDPLLTGMKAYLHQFASF